jgi:hypothetical protein
MVEMALLSGSSYIPGVQAATMWSDHTLEGHTYLGYRLLPCGVTTRPHGGHAHAMVSIPQADDIPVPSMGASQHHSHVVSLRPRVDKVNTLRDMACQVSGQLREQMRDTTYA